MNTGGETPAWQRRLKDQIGENPVRFLDQKIAEIPESPTSFFRARVEGIDRIEVVRAWQAAERRLASERGRQPRQHVLEILEQRAEWLEDHGERPADLLAEWPHELPDRYQSADRRVPEKEVHVRTETERLPYRDRPTVASFPSHEVATDGGEHE